MRAMIMTAWRNIPVKLLTVLLRLQVLTALWRVVVLQVGFDGLVLLVKEGKIRHKVLDNVHCGSHEGIQQQTRRVRN